MSELKELYSKTRKFYSNKDFNNGLKLINERLKKCVDKAEKSDLLNNKIEFLKALKRYEDCLILYDVLEKIEGEDFRVKKLQIYQALGAHEKILETYKSIFLENIQESHWINGMLYSLSVLGKDEELISWCDEILAIDKDNDDALFYKSLELFKKGQYSDALSLMNRKKYCDHLHDRLKIRLLIELKYYEEAFEICNKYEGKDKFAIFQNLKMAIIERKIEEELSDINDLKDVFFEGIKKFDKNKISYLSYSPFIKEFINKENEEKMVYHYTNVDGLMGIIENKKLWVTKSDYLNDYSELIFINNILDNILHTVSTHSNNDKDFLKFVKTLKFALGHQINKENLISGEELLIEKEIVIEYINDVIKKNEVDEVYILSTSKSDENLLLWGNYSNFSGYNIGLDKDEIIENFKKCNSTDFVINGSVIYENEEYENMDDLKNNTVYRFIEEIYNSCKKNKIDNNTMVFVALSNIQILSIFVKHHSMRLEDEYRIAFIRAGENSIYNEVSDKEKDPVKFRTKTGAIIPYITVPLIDENNIGNVIKSIKIGPTNNIDIAQKGLKEFLLKKGFKKEEVDEIVKKSNIPLRY